VLLLVPLPLPLLLLQVLDAALGPRLSSFKVFAVMSLSEVYQLPVVNSDMATDPHVVKRDGASWVQRQQPCVALIDLEPHDPQEQQQGQEQEQGLDGGGEGVAGEQGAADSVADAGEDDVAASAAAGVLPAGVGDAAGAAAGTDANPAGQEQPAQDQDQQQSASGSTRCDALYVVSPEKLIECCHQVSTAVASYIGLTAEEAGCGALDVGGLTSLLEKLLMVQVRPR
jgi:hypothetical protein